MIDVDSLAWDRMDGLLPAIVQHSGDGGVRMVGYMNRAALEATIADGFVTFFSRSRQTLWRKGEGSGNTLAVVTLRADCDGDALLIEAIPAGPTCHTGMTSCFGDAPAMGFGFFAQLEEQVAQQAKADPAKSYTARLLAGGVKRIAQKVGEEGVETALAAVAGDEAEVASEAADLVYHLTVLLQAREMRWQSVIDELRQRHVDNSATASS